MAIWKRLKKKTPEQEEKFRKQVNEYGLEKHDIFAMTVSALLTILPVCMLVLGGLVLFTLLLFRII